MKMTEEQRKGRREKISKKMRKVGDFFTGLLAEERDPIVMLSVLEGTSKIIADLYRVMIDHGSFSKSGKERLKKNFIRDIYTIVDGDGLLALLAEKAEKEAEEKRKQEKEED